MQGCSWHPACTTAPRTRHVRCAHPLVTWAEGGPRQAILAVKFVNDTPRRRDDPAALRLSQSRHQHNGGASIAANFTCVADEQD